MTARPSEAKESKAVTTTPGRAVPATLRRLGVLVVLAGVLAMHALAGGSHLAMASAPNAGNRPAASTPAGDPAAAGVHLMADSAPAHVVAVPAAVAGSAHGPLAAVASAAMPGSDVHAACLAVLLGLLLLAARAAFGVPRLLQAAVAHSAGFSSAPLGRGPPRQLLAQLCVLRT